VNVLGVAHEHLAVVQQQKKDEKNTNNNCRATDRATNLQIFFLRMMVLVFCVCFCDVAFACAVDDDVRFLAHRRRSAAVVVVRWHYCNQLLRMV
jgi:hypothetical protein